jgi:hypothetical protein
MRSLFRWPRSSYCLARASSWCALVEEAIESRAFRRQAHGILATGARACAKMRRCRRCRWFASGFAAGHPDVYKRPLWRRRLSDLCWLAQTLAAAWDTKGRAASRVSRKPSRQHSSPHQQCRKAAPPGEEVAAFRHPNDRSFLIFVERNNRLAGARLPLTSGALTGAYGWLHIYGLATLIEESSQQLCRVAEQSRVRGAVASTSEIVGSCVDGFFVNRDQFATAGY